MNPKAPSVQLNGEALTETIEKTYINPALYPYRAEPGREQGLRPMFTDIIVFSLRIIFN